MGFHLITVLLHVHVCALNVLAACLRWISYATQVSVIGDGRCGERIVAGDRLSNADALAQIGSQLPLPSGIRECRKDLSRKIFRYVCEV